ncbi:Anaerobic nitric oxide reductase transcription regulator NorR [bioreactor metagenome]|uniref:Sigma-54 factor interaction domain-containing protein n=2 Tax=root TaxID=1 RepID=Q24R71_DESHY|nr:hypothetical protein DSY3682 [Desulfitobacterium hafniense Y51]
MFHVDAIKLFHYAHGVLIELWFDFRSGRVTFKHISCEMFAQCLGNLAAAGIVSTDKGNLCFNAQFLPLPYKYYIYHIENCQPSLFELANGGTLFLDEIGDTPLEIQPVLLRVFEEKRVTRLGGSRGIPVDFRVIAATNKNLSLMVKEETFRQIYRPVFLLLFLLLRNT